MKNSERPAWMGQSRRPPQASPPAPPQPAPQAPSAEAPRPIKRSSRGYNPYDTVNTRLPDVSHVVPKKSSGV